MIIYGGFSSILLGCGFSIINHQIGDTSIYGTPYIVYIGVSKNGGTAI